jgi:hypothetical protein
LEVNDTVSDGSGAAVADNVTGTPTFASAGCVKVIVCGMLPTANAASRVRCTCVFGLVSWRIPPAQLARLPITAARRTLLNSLNVLPSQDAEHGTEPLLYAATSPATVAGGYYGPGGRFGLVGPTTTVRPPRRARDAAAATRLWAEAERLTGVALPAGAVPRQTA